jgi:hypothetical protein
MGSSSSPSSKLFRDTLEEIIVFSSWEFPQSYLSKVWRYGGNSHREAVLKTLFKLKVHELTIEDVFTEFRALAFQVKATTKCTFNLDFVTKRQLDELGFILQGRSWKGRRPRDFNED